jgi:hypothetical protein
VNSHRRFEGIIFGGQTLYARRSTKLLQRLPKRLVPLIQLHGVTSKPNHLNAQQHRFEKEKSRVPLK